MKKTTSEVHKKISSIGRALGFEVKEEYSFKYDKNEYVPRHDVVWFIKSDFKLNKIQESISDALYHDCLKEIPFATFEIEGSTTSSKNQIGNLVNLALSPSFFNFIIVDNEGAGKENDTFRRAIKIYNTYEKSVDIKNLFVLDWQHIKQIDEKKYKKFKLLTGNSDYSMTRTGAGGESVSKEIFNKLKSNGFFPKDLIHKNNWEPESLSWLYSKFEEIKKYDTPEELDFLLLKRYVHNPKLPEIKKVKSMKDSFYIPKIDVVSGFYISKEVNKFFEDISFALGDLSHSFPFLSFIRNKNEDLFFPLLGYEMESSDSKHMSGGIINVSKYCFIGFLVSNLDLTKNFSFHKTQLGIKNTFFIRTL